MNFLAISTEITILLLALFLIVMDLVLPERESRKAMEDHRRGLEKS